MKQFDYPDLEPVVPDPFGGEVSTGEGEAERAGIDLSLLDGQGVDVLDGPNAGARSYRLLNPLPLRRDGAAETLSEIRLRHARQDEIDAWGRGEISRRDMLCLMAGQPRKVIGALSWPDSEALHRMFGDMVPDFILNPEG